MVVNGGYFFSIVVLKKGVSGLVKFEMCDLIVCLLYIVFE